MILELLEEIRTCKMSSFTEEDLVKKKLRIESDVYDAFNELFLKNNPSFFDSVEKFKDEITALGAYEIGSCNAADPDNGYCFTEAVCTLKPTRHKLAFANIFLDAFVMLKNFIITKKEIPTDDGKRVVLERLVKFLLNNGEKMTHYLLHMHYYGGMFHPPLVR